MTPRLVFDSIACARGGRTLFEDLSFDLRGGGAMRVTGPNGAGKSSLLRLAAGLLTSTGGALTREGGIALADEKHALDRTQPLLKALQYWAAIDGGDARVGLDALGLAHLAEVPVRMLSTGQRRRATLARTIATRAPIWLLDEPANGLDAEAVAMLETLIAEHRASGGIAIVATHQPVDLHGAEEVRL
ncbi:MAG: heme ABC exporter ATP-binding protein CcmA [Sphingomonadaceae bacterium]|nr:heme ABC exporter ATP-binding protein CcmA [Sphingomonadaceae bacterium]